MAEPDLSQYDPVFQAAGNEWNIDPTLLKAVAAQESGGRTSAVSSKGAQGLMQITPDTQKYLGVTDPNDPVQSIYGAAKYLSEGLDKEGSPEGALLYYHGGPGWRQAYGPESRAYVPGVTAHYVALKPPDQTQDVPAASTGPLIVGDSLASKGGLGGSGVIGASPKAVLGNVTALPGDQVNGRDVVLSSGASNDPSQAGLLEQQIKALQDKGAKSVTVVGVGDAPKLQGVNDGLAATAGRFGANFVPLDTTQLSPDRVHPTQQGYRTLLAAATPKVATDASPAPAGSQGQGKAMASSDLPSWLPPAPQASGGASAAPSAAATSAGNGAANTPAATTPSDTLPSWLPPAPKSSTPTQQEPSWSAYGDATGGDQNLPSWMMQGPAGQTVDEKVRNLLAPAPNTTYGDVLPLARDDKTGEIRLAMPNALRAPLIGLTGGGGWSQSGNITVDPVTGAERLSPEAASVAPFAATPLRFGASPGLGNALIDTTRAPTLPPDIVSPDLAARQAARAATAPMAEAPYYRQYVDPTEPFTYSAPSTGWPAGTEHWAEAPSTPVPSRYTEPDVSPASPPSSTSASASGQGPQPVGAQATPPGAATLTPAEVAAYRATAEGNKLLENQRVGEPDRTAYVPGVTPNSAELEQTATAARELKSLGITSPEASNEAKLAAQANNDARTSYFNDTARSPVDIQKAEADRAAQADADLKATWANKTDADASSVLDTADAIKSSPDGRRPAVRSAVDSITNELTDANGNLITDPEQLYGVRKHIDDLLSKEGQRETPLAARATASLQALKDQLDTVIEAAAPGFKQYLKNFSDASKPIDEMHVLQDAAPGLFKGPNATLRYSDFQRFMKNVVDMRNTQGVNPYKSISDDTMQRLWNLRDDLRRSAGAQELARAPGSDTAPNIIDALKQYAKLGGSAAVDAAAAHLFGPAGPMMVRGAKAMLAPVTAQRTARAQMGRMREMLYPSNPLNPPPGP